MEEMFDRAKDYVAQDEIGDEGTPHIQGVVRFKLQKDLAAVKLALPRAHLEICRDYEASKEYCAKLDTRAPDGRTWSTETSWEAALYDPLEGKELYLWQKHLKEKIDAYEVDMRTIYWYWEREGNTGKSAICRHLLLTGYNLIYVYGSTKDIAYILAEKKKAASKPSDMPSIILYDCPRTGVVNYHGLEMIKNGMFMSGKYESSMVTMNPPFVCVLANEPPKAGELSKDRLKVYWIDEDNEAMDDNEWAAPIMRLRRSDGEVI